jgi:hypothetical protein
MCDKPDNKTLQKPLTSVLGGAMILMQTKLVNGG